MLLKRVWLTERDKLPSLNAEWRMTDSRSREKSLRELEFNDLNIHLDRSRLANTRSAENDQIGPDTDPEYRLDACIPSDNYHYRIIAQP